MQHMNYSHTNPWPKNTRINVVIRTKPNEKTRSCADPPPRAPVIEGYVKDEVLQEGHILTMTCSVAGGKPLVTSVIFACSGHSDTVPDVRSSDRVQSYLNLSPLKVGDNGDRCVCTAEWKKTDWYRLSATVSLRVNGKTLLQSGS